MRDWQSRDESGHALVELSIVAFILFLIAFWSVELSRVLRFQQMATALSRELASVVYRECLADNAAFPTPRSGAAVSQFDPRTCIPDVMTREFLPRLNRIAPTATVTVSYFGYDPATGASLDYRTPAGRTRFNEAQIQAEVAGVPSSRSDLANALVNLGALVVGEVELPYTGLGFGGGAFVGFITDRVYGVTIL